MIETKQDLSIDTQVKSNLVGYDKSYFTEKITRLGGLASNILGDPNFDALNGEKEIKIGLKAFEAQGTLQEMLVTEMITIHQLQQTAMIAANELNSVELKKYFINTTIKLANTFVQQATLLSKLQGKGGQQINIDCVEVNQGGQAIVGNFEGVSKN